MTTISFVIQGETRHEAWLYAEKIVDDKLRGIATVNNIGQEPLPDPEEWIAINEPIKAQG